MNPEPTMEHDPSRPLPLFPAGVVGSMPRPQWVRDLLEPEMEARLGPAEHRRQLAAAVAFAVELQAARDAGATIVQFDDPHLCLFVDERVRAQYRDPEREIPLCVEMLNAIVEEIDGVTIALHLCRRNRGREGWVGEGGYEPIL